MTHLSRSARVVIAALITVVVLEAAARAMTSEAAEPLRWYDATAELKIDQIRDAASRIPIGSVAGSSMAWQGLLAGVLTDDETTAYNSSLAGGVPPVTQRWLTEEVVPRVAPDTVIWGLSSLDFAPNYGDENLARYDDARETAEGLLADVERASSQRLALVSRRTQLRDPAFFLGSSGSSLEVDRQIAETSTFPNGDRTTYPRDTSPELAGVQRARLAGFEISPSDSMVVEETVEWLHARGIRVILVEMPVPDRFVQLHPQGPDSYELVSEEMVRLGDATGADVLQASDWFGDDDFVDFTHLEQSPAQTLSESVAAFLDDEPFVRPRDEPSDEPIDEPIDEIVSDQLGDESPTDDPSPITPVDPEQCTEQTVEDEYGFEIEVLVCPEGEVPEDLPTDRAVVVGDPDDRVSVGTGGWLFYTPSVQQLCATEDLRDQWLQEVELTQQILASSGKDLFIAVIPDRGIVAGEFLGDIDNSCQRLNNELIESLAEQHPAVVSLDTVVDSPDLVRQTDTHWNPSGALLGAKAIVDEIDPDAWQSNDLTSTILFPNIGDLVEFSGGVTESNVEFLTVDIDGLETVLAPTSSEFPALTATNPAGSDHEVLLIHDSNGGHDGEPGLGAYYVRPWFERATSLRALPGQLQTMWDESLQPAVRDSDTVAVLFVQRNVTAWLGTGRLSVGIVGALAEDEAIADRREATRTFPAQQGDGVVLISGVASPADVEVTSVSGRIGHRVDGTDSFAIYVGAGTALEFSDEVDASFVPFDQYRD